ncbi:MAG: nodulation protein NodZ [Microcystaceae cyanobacterium]
MIICKGTSGLGNRILAACTTLLYSRISNRKFLIDWRDDSYSNGQGNSFPTFFDCFSPLYVKEMPPSILNGNSIYPKLWNGNLEQTFGGLRAQLNMKGYQDMSFDVSQRDYDSDVLVFCAYTHKIRAMNSLFTGEFEYLSELETNDILRSILRQIKLKGHIYEAIQRYKETHFGFPTIGVHVRNTDMKISPEILINKVKTVLSNTQGEKIFLATDAKDTIDLFRDAFGDRVITTEKWFAPNGERLHQNWDQCPDREQNGIEALTDMYLLAECDRLVFSSQSTFGVVASLLSKAEKKHLYDVRNNAQNKNLITRIHNKLRKNIFIMSKITSSSNVFKTS